MCLEIYSSRQSDVLAGISHNFEDNFFGLCFFEFNLNIGIFLMKLLQVF